LNSTEIVLLCFAGILVWLVLSLADHAWRTRRGRRAHDHISRAALRSLDEPYGRRSRLREKAVKVSEE
jgi:hypothetical protein